MNFARESAGADKLTQGEYGHVGTLGFSLRESTKRVQREVCKNYLLMIQYNFLLLQR